MTPVLANGDLARNEASDYEGRVATVMSFLAPSIAIGPVSDRDRAERLLADLGIEKPKPPWPSAHSLSAFRAAWRSTFNEDLEMGDDRLRDCLRESHVADPIVKCARALRDADTGATPDIDVVQCVIDSVNEASL